MVEVKACVPPDVRRQIERQKSRVSCRFRQDRSEAKRVQALQITECWPQLCKGTKAAIGFHSFGFLIPRFFVRFTRSAGEGLQRFAMMNFWVDPLASSAAISGRCSPCLLLPGPFGRPTGRPKARLVGRSSFICAEINPRSTAAIIVPPKSRSKSSPKTGGRQIDDTYAVSIGYQKSYGRFGTFA